MNKGHLFYLITVFMFFMINGCSSNEIERIQVYQMKSFIEFKDAPIMSYTDTKDVQQIVDAFRSGKQEAGIVNMADPDYKVVIGKESYYLWISDEHGSIMNIKDTHTIFSLPENSVVNLKKLLK